MADSNNNNNPTGFPPPPPTTNAGRTVTPPPRSKGASPAPPHSTVESIPNLASAPPSGNYPMQQQQQQQQPQPQMRAMPPQQFQQNFSQLPPPPPMPPQHSTGSSPLSAQSGTSGSAGGGYDLPPPPVMSAVAKPPMSPPRGSAAPTLAVAASMSPDSSTHSSHQGHPPPPPPPPPHQQQQQHQFPPPPPPQQQMDQYQHHTQAMLPPEQQPQTQTQQEPPQEVTEEEPQSLPLNAFTPANIQYLAKRQSHVPILVMGTERAHKLAWKNNLRLADMLDGLARTLPDYTSGRPISPFRSITKSLTLGWKDARLTFVSSDDLAQPMDYDTAQETLQQLAQLQGKDGDLQTELNLLEDQVDALLQDDCNTTTTTTSNTSSYDYMQEYESRVKQKAQVVKDAFQLTSPLNIPWLLRYRHALDASTDQMPHDLINCPPVVLLVCTTQENTPLLDCLRELGSRHYLPEAYTNGLYDPNTLRKEVLVLHDTVSGPRDWDEAGLKATLQRHFGPGAAIVRMNGILPQTALQLAQEETQDEWGGGGRCGNCLSHSDRVNLRQYLEQLTTSTVLPALERRIADLNVIVSDRKKGVKNVFKSFWRKPKEAQEESNKQKGDVAYRFDAIESQTRLLADTLFLVKDYETALGMYRLIRDDYKHDKAMMHYASVQEMMALSMYFLDPYSRARDIVAHIETALLAYSKAAEEERPIDNAAKNSRSLTATHATRCATRLCLWLSSTSDTILKGRHLEVADLLASASSHETALGAAVLLEQSSAQYYHAQLYRKYAFHMLMSGHMFRTSQQEAHAFRCFTSALYLYRDKPWTELHNHLRSALAAQLFSMERMAVSVQLYARLVGITMGGMVSVKSQQKFVNNLLLICNDHPKKALVGADRMAAPPSLSNADRDRFRQQRLDKIVEVIQYTQGAQRILELPRVRLPTIDDASLAVETPEHVVAPSQGQSLLGRLEDGSEAVWKELQMMTIAELRAAEASKVQSMDDEVITKALAQIEDYDTRCVIAQVDKEKQNRNLQERYKRSSSYRGEIPPVRARGEPLRVKFSLTNPLSISVDMSDIQLVARMTDTEGRVFTNEESIHIAASAAKDQTWNFESSDLEFHVAQFSRLSPVSGSDNKAWTAGVSMERPYFVVSKHSLQLGEQGKGSVALGICPLVEGNLEIVGVRGRLLDDIWVYHPFEVQGPLLHNTRTNRANRVRAESVTLKATIRQDMPCLKIQMLRPSGDAMEASQDPLLEGQMGSWVLRICNVGTAPATNVSLKTSMPWISVPQSVSDLNKENLSSSKINALENRATSCCVGPTGTLIRLPLHGPQLKQEGSIQPGENVDVPIQIKAGSSGTQDFYMLYRYELDDPSSQLKVRPHRWLRRMYKVPVYPSLSLTASILPSSWGKGEHILSIELTNHRNDRPSDINIILEKINLVSRCYRLERMPGQFTDNEKNGLQIEWRERITVHYRLIPFEKEINSCLLSACSFAEEPPTIVECALTSAADYLCLEKAWYKFEGTWKSHQLDILAAQSAKDREEQHPRSISQIRKANSGLEGTKSQESGVGGDNSEVAENEAAHSTSISKIFPQGRGLTKVNLICSWSAGKVGSTINPKIYGQHHLRSIAVRPASKTMDCPITITGDYPAAVSHDFQLGPVIVPFKATLSNQLVRAQVNFDFEVQRPAYFEFIGAKCFNRTLEGGKEIVVPMQAVIPCPGIFNLQTINVTIDEGHEKVAYDFPVQWLVSISDESSS